MQTQGLQKIQSLRTKTAQKSITLLTTSSKTYLPFPGVTVSNINTVLVVALVSGVTVSNINTVLVVALVSGFRRSELAEVLIFVCLRSFLW